MTKGGKLIWELFMWLREVMPLTPENTRRQQEWAARFHEMETPEPAAPVAADAAEPGQATTTADHDDDTEPSEPLDPHEHGVPPRRQRKKK